MDGLMKLLWPLSNLSGPSMTIPTYRQGEQEDQIDLQIKSLMYMFKRCGIANSKPFAEFVDSSAKQPNSMHGRISKLKSSGNLRSRNLGEQSLEVSGGISPVDRQKLDIMYNKSQFERLIAHDEHRVLVDWIKNKFRSLCILSDNPKDIARLPSFGEYSDKYWFVVLPADSADEMYIDILVNSSLYCEHSLPKDTKVGLATAALGVARSKYGTYVLDKDARALVIKHYLQTLAIEIQVDRLYRGSLQAKTIDTRQNDRKNYLDRIPRELQNLGQASNDQSASRSRSSSRSPSPVSRPIVRPTSPARSPERTKFYMHQSLLPVKGSSSGSNNGDTNNSNSSSARIGHFSKGLIDNSVSSNASSLPKPVGGRSKNGSDTLHSQIDLTMTTRSSRSRNTSPSPVRSLNIGTPPSPTSSARSPPRTLKSKGSMPILSLSMNKMPNLSPRVQEKDDTLSEESKKEILAQSRLAVNARIERERGVIRFE